MVMSFKDRYCAHFGCSPAEFEEHFLFRCLPWYAYFLGKLFRHLDKKYFKPDLALIQVLAFTGDASEFRREIANFRFQEPPQGLFRRHLTIRFSARKAMRLADQALGKNWGNS
jgi:hypothetical protein